MSSRAQRGAKSIPACEDLVGKPEGEGQDWDGKSSFRPLTGPSLPCLPCVLFPRHSSTAARYLSANRRRRLANRRSSTERRGRSHRKMQHWLYGSTATCDESTSACLNDM